MSLYYTQISPNQRKKALLQNLKQEARLLRKELGNPLKKLVGRGVGKDPEKEEQRLKPLKLVLKRVVQRRLS